MFGGLYKAPFVAFWWVLLASSYIGFEGPTNALRGLFVASSQHLRRHLFLVITTKNLECALC